MQDTLPEGTARATQRSLPAQVGGSANRSVVGRVSPRKSGSSNAAQSLASRGGHEIGSVSACGEQVGGQLYRWLRGL